jgi:hypothetical protein
MWALGVAVWATWIALGGKRKSVTIAVFWLLLALGSLGSLFGDDSIRTVAILVLATTAVYAVYRLAIYRGIQLITNWASFFVVLLPLGSFAVEAPRLSESDPGPEPLQIAPFTDRPDVVVLVADALGSQGVLEDFYAHDMSPALGSLERHGMEVVPGMKSNYSLTYLSLPSFFDMSYPAEDGEVLTDSDVAESLRQIGGQNRLVEAFQSQGYEFVMVESGWSGGQCTGAVDVCIRSPWPDDATSFAIDRSVFSLARGWFKGSHTAGTLHTIDWLESELPGYLEDDVPQLIFAHLLTPHAPLWLEPDCTYRWKPKHGGLTVGVPDIDQQTLQMRKDAYVGQVECALGVVESTAARTGDDALFLAMGDHGPDSQAQLFEEPVEWSPSDIEERMHVFFAAKAAGCGFEDLTSLVNVGGMLLACLTGVEDAPIGDRHFIATGPEGVRSESHPMLEVEVP